MRGAFVQALAFKVVLTLLCLNASGQVLIEQLTTVPSPPREGSPWMVNLTLTQAKAGPPIEGNLILKIVDTKEQGYFSWTSHPLAVSTGSRNVVWWLPPTQPAPFARTLRLQAFWSDPDGKEDFVNEWPMQTLDPLDVNTHLAIIDDGTDQQRSTFLAKLAKQVGIAESIQLAPHFRAALTTEYRSLLAPALVPESPLAFCAFDAVILSPSGFAALQAKQLNAIQRWVRAGGKLLVMPYGEPLREEHTRFLKGVARSMGELGAFERSPRTRLLKRYRTAYSLHRHGLGRTLIYAFEPSLTRSKQRLRWSRTRCEWWQAPIDEHGTWDGMARFSSLRSNNSETLIQSLQVRGPWLRIPPIPLLLFGALGLGFILLIGPVDYHLLGRLKRRRWTWLLFPTLTLSFAFGLQSYIEKSYHKRPDRTLRILDLDTAGNPVRESHFRLSMEAEETRTAKEIEDAIYSLVSPLDTVDYRGSFPSKYQAHERRVRWKPAIHRTFRIPPLNEAPHPKLSQLDWLAISPNAQAWTPQRQKEIAAEARAAFPRAALRFLEYRSGEDSPLTMPKPRHGRTKRHWDRNLISPSGGTNPQDLLLHDQQLENQKTLVIEIPEARETTTLYRITYP